jgi:GNAT superfamily N-acetyltransferase
MPLEIVSFEAKHLEDAATLVTQRYQRLCDSVPYLPDAYTKAGTFLPLLTRLCAQAPGVVALSDGQVVGFLLARLIPDMRGCPSTYCPEWANGATADDTRRIYQEMYTALSARWVAGGFFEHFITLFADDEACIDAWQWLGFGRVVVDALRDLSAVPAVPCEVAVRRATVADLAVALPLWRGLHAHLAAAPTFLVDGLEADDEEFADWLREPANALWLAESGGEAVASLGIGPANHNACTIIRDPGTASIVSAFTRPDGRGSGVATALLDSALAWARSAGYRRCSVDFEAMNVPAARFWLRYFTPVCHSLGRHINPRIVQT